MISTDPFDSENRAAIYISAKRGLGIKVVEGQRIAEQIIFRPRTNAVQVLTRSAEDSLLTFDEKGGVKEVPITGDRVVLTDDVIRRLVRAAVGDQTRLRQPRSGHRVGLHERADLHRPIAAFYSRWLKSLTIAALLGYKARAMFSTDRGHHGYWHHHHHPVAGRRSCCTR